MFVTNPFIPTDLFIAMDYEGGKNQKGWEKGASASALGASQSGIHEGGKETKKNSQLTARFGFFFLRVHVKSSELKN